MILYFSATGNCKYVAERVARALGLEALSIVDCIRAGRFAFAGEVVGIVSPTYDWGLPSIVEEFLKQARVEAEYLFFAATYGTTPGAIGYMAGRALAGRKIDAHYAVRMPDTWTPIFDLSTPEKVAVFTKNTEAEIEDLIRGVAERRTKRCMWPRTPGFITRWIARPIYDRRVRRTEHLRVEESCIGCGACARKCPVQAIEMRDGRPVWVKEKCVMCLGCLHRCPKFAIQYGPNTKKHGQYLNPNVRI